MFNFGFYLLYFLFILRGPMRNLVLIFLFLTFSRVALVLEPSDRLGIENAINSYVNAWNHNKGKGFGDSFTQDADFVNIFGMNFSGRDEIEKRHVEILSTFLKNSIFEVQKICLREAAKDIAIALVHWKVEGFKSPNSENPSTIYGVFSHTFIKEEGVWKITACQNTLKKI